MDRVLTRFFHGEMPQPWPACPRVRVETKAPATLTLRRFFRIPGRFAVAAAVAALVIGYLALASWFPEPTPTPRSNIDANDPYARGLPKPGQYRDTTKSGRPVGIEVQKTGDPKTLLIISEELPAKKK